MSKYALLWHYVQQKGERVLKLNFANVQAITGFSMAHAFLSHKKELLVYGYQVGKISPKEQTVIFNKPD